ncbi:MAG: RNA 3'-phosphate cyclase [Deltaproteobacteria bacterium]|nr:RNA 3'-phosphate cyclase [Deltaproteobacteria bacterium]
MIAIDGSTYSGSGTILRYGVALSSLTGEPLRVFNIRARRDKPGLRPQHLQAVRACARLSNGQLQGDEVGSREIVYHPGRTISGGSFDWDIGTAGSATMLSFTLIPLALFAEKTCRFTITGGLFQDFAPTCFHMQHALIPLVRRMGGEIGLTMLRPGYVPKGQGKIQLDVRPVTSTLDPLRLTQPGTFNRVEGMALSSHLASQRVSERMAEKCVALLDRAGLVGAIQTMDDDSAVQRGAALCLWAESDTGALIGADQAGKRGRRSESIAGNVVRNLLEDIRSGGAVDRHLADQLILFAALAEGASAIGIPAVTDHVESNRWLVERILGARTDLKDHLLEIEGVGLRPGGSGR